MARQDTLEHFNDLFAEEIEAGIRYLHLAVTVKGLDRLMVRKILLQNMQETLEHAQIIADKILQLGGIPRLQMKLELDPEKSSAAEAIRTAVAFEQAALDSYRELLEKVQGQEDVVIEEFLRAQIAIESEHVSELELLLER